MKKQICTAAAMTVMGIWCQAAETPAPAITYPQLVHRLVDLEQLAVLPPAGERGAQASSYDRRSRYDAATDRYIDWSANGDGKGIIRTEGDDSVLAEIQGPGCIWRTWSATPGKGHVRIYLEGSSEPAVDLPFTGYFDGKNEPFTRPELVYTTTANGFNNFTPIPFNKSCKIVGEKRWGNYFHFTYTQFAPGTVVPTFSRKMSEEDSAALDKANEVLAHCGVESLEHLSRSKIPFELPIVDVPAGGESDPIEPSLYDPKVRTGPLAITGLRVKVPNLPTDREAQRTLLGQLTVRIAWDGEKDPSVWSPLGDFFASSAGATPFQSYPAGVMEDGTFYCKWYMPSASSARITFGNDSAKPVQITYQVETAPLSRPIAELGRFHAKWHRDAFLPERADRAPDWTILKTSGRGRFVGVALHVWNPRGGWWGEGDEKFFVDGEKFPSTFGTGSEDYFGYAWSSGKTFVRPFHDQPYNDNNHGHVNVDRWEIAESVPFQQSFEGCIEKYFANARPTLYSAVAYWYLAPGGNDGYSAVPVDQRVGWWVRPEAYREKDAMEGEALKVLSHTKDPVDQQDMSGYKTDKWSDQAQLFWRGHQAGGELVLGFPVKEAGKYHVKARFTKAPDYGIFQPAVDGAPAGTALDLFDPKVVGSPTIDLGQFDLTEGDHKISFTATGKNPQSRGFYFGLDYIKLEK